MSGIAEKFGVSLNALIAANPQIKNPDLIYTGDVLSIPTKPSQVKKYTVVAGDTMSGIAAKFGVSLSALVAANPQIKNPDLIYAGQVLTIRPDTKIRLEKAAPGLPGGRPLCPLNKITAQRESSGRGPISPPDMPDSTGRAHLLMSRRFVFLLML